MCVCVYLYLHEMKAQLNTENAHTVEKIPCFTRYHDQARIHSYIPKILQRLVYAGKLLCIYNGIVKGFENFICMYACVCSRTHWYIPEILQAHIRRRASLYRQWHCEKFRCAPLQSCSAALEQRWSRVAATMLFLHVHLRVALDCSAALATLMRELLRKHSTSLRPFAEKFGSKRSHYLLGAWEGIGFLPWSSANLAAIGKPASWRVPFFSQSAFFATLK